MISTEDHTDRFLVRAPGSFPVQVESQFLSKSLKKGITGFLRIPAGISNLAVVNISHDDPSSAPWQVHEMLHSPDCRSEVICQLHSNSTFNQEVQSGLESCPPPIISNAAFNNEQVNWKQCMHSYPVDVRAFSVYYCGHKKGQAQPSADKMPGRKLCTGEYKEGNHAKRRVIDAILKLGTFEQQ